MPFIRDSSWAYESVTTDAGVTIPMCAYEPGDIALVFAVGDSGAPAWGCSNGVGTWNQRLAQNNGASCVVFWKYLTVGEGDVVVTSTVNETYSGALVVVGDCFQGYTVGAPPTASIAAQAASSKFAIQGLTTVDDDSLVITGSANTGASASIILVDGVMHNLLQVDGAAESLGLGWLLQRTAGAIPTPNVVVSNTNGTGLKFSIEVRRPAGGATVIPAYTASEPSVFVSARPGLAYDGNAALAANADTDFGTTIAGKTCNDATITGTVNDIGIDPASFCAFSSITNVAGATTMSGASMAIAAARYNVGSRNVLTHLRHSTPVQNQLLSPVNGGRGVWFGMKSGATAGANWKVWQVHGSDVPIPPGSARPIVLNAANPDAIGSNGTLSSSDVRVYGYWTGGKGAFTQAVSFGPLWIMDATVICGGSASAPIDVPAMVKAIANDKVRISAQLQGSNQALVLQRVRFGNGGTDPLQLDFRGGAIEFPSRRNAAKKLVNYNGVDDSVGFEFYPGPAGAVDLRGATFSSDSPFYFGVHPSASAAAAWSMAGATVRGAGTVALGLAGLPAGGMTIADYVTLDLAGADFSNGNILDVPAGSDTATVTGATFVGASIDVSGVASGNRWASVADPTVFNGASFVGGGGHAYRITTPGTYAINAQQFAGFGANGSNGAAIYNDSGGAVTLNISGGGSTPTVRNGAGASTSVVSGATVTFTGLPTGTDIVILTAGTTTILHQVDQHPSSSFAWAYSGSPTVDVGFFKPGYVPFYLRSLALAPTDASIPVSLTLDRNYT